MPYFLRPQSSGTRIRLEGPNSSSSTCGKAVRHQPKWRARSAGSSTIDLFLSSSDPATEEEVTHPISQDRAKTQVVKASLPLQWVALCPLSRS
jgi:hypothetical protein